MTDAIICPGAGQTDTRRWLCRWHFAVKDDFEDGRHVLDDLLANRQPRAENWCDKLVHERIANSTDPLMARARLIAEGKGDDQDKHDLLRDLQKRLTGFAARTKVPDAPA